MTRTLIIKNMVCNRCKTIVKQLLDNENFEVISLELGKAVVNKAEKNDYTKLEKRLNKEGFELIKTSSEVLVEQIKIRLIENINKSNTELMPSQLAEELGKTYSVVSKTFSKSEGITLEKYVIRLKIEKVKELIQLKQLNFSEIAHRLNYNTSSHLAKQFKNITGMSMSEYQKLQDWDRKSLDQIV